MIRLWRYLLAKWETRELLHDLNAVAAIKEGLADVDADEAPRFVPLRPPFLKVHSMSVVSRFSHEDRRTCYQLAGPQFGFPIYVEPALPRDLIVFVAADGELTFFKVTS